MESAKEKQRKSSKAWKQRNKDRILAYQREWNKKHPQKWKEYEARRDKEHRKQYNKEYWAKRKEHYLELYRGYKFKYYWKKKLIVINALGAKCSCCGNIDTRVLEIHHKNGEGTKEYKEAKSNYIKYLKGLMKHLQDLQLLCANCHIIDAWEHKLYLKSNISQIPEEKL